MKLHELEEEMRRAQKQQAVAPAACTSLTIRGVNRPESRHVVLMEDEATGFVGRYFMGADGHIGAVEDF